MQLHVKYVKLSGIFDFFNLYKKNQNDIIFKTKCSTQWVKNWLIVHTWDTTLHKRSKEIETLHYAENYVNSSSNPK